MLRLQQWLLLIVVATVGIAGLMVGGVVATDAPGSSAVGVDGSDAAFADTNETDDVDDDGDETDDGAEDGDEDTAPAEFTITNVETNTPVTAGENVEVTVDLHNTGDETAERTVSFSLDQYQKDETDVELEPNETRTVTLSYVSKSGDAKDWTMTVETPDDSVSETVTIEEKSDSSGSSSGYSSGYTTSWEPVFELESFEIDGPVKAGEQLTMNATVVNTGDTDGEKLLWFTIGDSTFNETVLSLDQGEERTVSVTFNSSVDQAGEWNFTAETPDDELDGNATITELVSDIRIDDVNTNAPVEAGEPVTVTVDLVNVGDIEGEETVPLFLGDHLIDERTVTLAPNESATVELTYRTNEWNTGDLDASVSAGESEEAFTITVEEPTPTPTATPTETPTESTPDETPTAASPTPTPETETTEGSVFGFGAVALIVALLAVATIAARR